jgi:hypothetical protein
VLVDGADHRDHDRREEDEEAPEDRRMDEARDDALKQLLLAEDDDGLVLHALGRIAEAVDRLAEPDQRDEQLRPPIEQRAADGKERSKRERSGGDVYDDRAFPRAAIRRAPFGALP